MEVKFFSTVYLENIIFRFKIELTFYLIFKLFDNKRIRRNTNVFLSPPFTSAFRKFSALKILIFYVKYIRRVRRSSSAEDTSVTKRKTISVFLKFATQTDSSP